MRQKQPDLSEDAEDYVMSQFPNGEIKEKLPTLLVVQIPQRNINISNLFAVMENGKGKKGLIEDYSIGQTGLDQLFINFASKQNEDTMLESFEKSGRKSTLDSSAWKKRSTERTT